MFKHLLFACDLSNTTEAHFQQMLEFARPMQARITLFHAYDNLSVTQAALQNLDLSKSLNEIQLAVEEKAWIFLEAYHKKLNEAGLLSEIVVVSGHPGAQIAKTATHRDCDLIVIGKRSNEAIKSVLLGSKSTYILHHSPCAVLVLPDSRV